MANEKAEVRQFTITRPKPELNLTWPLPSRTLSNHEVASPLSSCNLYRRIRRVFLWFYSIHHTLSDCTCLLLTRARHGEQGRCLPLASTLTLPQLHPEESRALWKIGTGSLKKHSLGSYKPSPFFFFFLAAFDLLPLPGSPWRDVSAALCRPRWVCCLWALQAQPG